MTRAPAAVAFRDLHMVFPVRWGAPVHALRGLTLTVPKGSIFGLLGPNGCGKTTAISCALGLLCPQAGAVEIAGRKVGSEPHQARERPYGVLLEDTRLPSFVTVTEGLRAVAELRGYRGAQLRTEVGRVVEACGIEDLQGRRVAVLSKGQARRVGLSAALVGDPPLLLLDEPSSGLDVAARVEFEATLRSLRDERRTILVASHFLGDVQNTCSHVAIMRDGAVITTGRTAELVGDETDGAASDVYVDADSAQRLAEVGMATAASRYADLVKIDAAVDDATLLRILLSVGITPRRMEPRTSLLSVYLDLTDEDSAP